jgi:hypothetical protein
MRQPAAPRTDPPHKLEVRPLTARGLQRHRPLRGHADKHVPREGRTVASCGEEFRRRRDHDAQGVVSKLGGSK